MKRSLFAIILIFAAFAIMAQDRIDTPELVNPSNADDDQMPDVMLDWNAVAAALNYQVQLSEDADFNTIVLDSTTDLTSVKTNQLKFGTEYFWRVKANDIYGGTSYWTPVWSFTTFSTVNLDKPNDGADEQDPDVTLKWKNKVSSVMISGVDYFDIQIDTTNAFNSSQFAEFTTGGSTFNKPMDQLLFGVTYYWHVRARHATDASDWSITRSFTVLDIFSLKKPNDGVTDQDLNVQLRWEDVSGIKKYDYQVDNDEDFSSPDSYVTDTFKVIAQELKFGITYYWRARGRHDFDTTLWAEPRHFTTWVTVEPESPGNGADSVVLKPKLEWSQIKGVNSYEVSYAPNENFTDAFTDFQPADDDINPYYYILYDLDEGTTYYWRVRACTAIDTSIWSEVYTFTTIPAAGIDEYFSRAEVSIYPNPATTEVNIEMNISEPADIEFSLIDLAGQTLMDKVFSFTGGNNSKTIDLSNLTNGIYLLRMNKGQYSYSRKLIIKN